MDPDLAGFIGLAALMMALVAWLRSDMNGRMERLARIETMQAEQGERLTRIEGTVVGALGRPFPELMTRAPDVAAAE